MSVIILSKEEKLQKKRIYEEQKQKQLHLSIMKLTK